MNKHTFLSATVTLSTALSLVALTPFAALAARTVTGRAIVNPNPTNDTVPVTFESLSPRDIAVEGKEGDMAVNAKTEVYQAIGQTKVGGPQMPPKLKRMTSRALKDGEEVTFKGTYTPGNEESMQALKVIMNDRNFAVCGNFQSLQFESDNHAFSNNFVVGVKKVTVQEAKYARYFPLGKDVRFSFDDAAQFALANGSWKAPKNRLGQRPEGLTGNQQGIRVVGKITGQHTFEAHMVDVGVKCQ